MRKLQRPFTSISYIALAGVLFLSCSVYFSHPTKVNAVGQAACVCQLDDPKKPLYCPTVRCADATNDFTTSGMCAYPGVCAGNATSDGTLGSLGQLLQGVASLMKALQSPPGAGAGGAGDTGITNPACPNGTYTVTVPSTDPCAIYQASSTADGIVSSLNDALNSTAGSDLSGLLGGSTDTDVSSNSNGQRESSANTGAGVTVGTVHSLNATTAPPMGVKNTIQPQGNGIHGDLKIDAKGVTAFVSNQNQQGNKTIAAFYGIDTYVSVDATTIATQMCLYRPWATNFLASVAPAAFFDGLCTLHKFKVGLPAPVITPVTSSTQTKAPVVEAPATTTTPVSGYTGPNVPPQVQVWAVPTSVPLGSRTSIFWNTQGVYNCTVTSPDGSFNQNTTSRGASTVPLTTDTTFTISCLTPDNTPATAYTTVHLSI